MSRLTAVGDGELHRNNEMRLTWRRLLADEDEFIYDGQAEINRQIASRLQNEAASRSKGEVLATLLEEQMQSLARSELFVLCTMSIATKLSLETQVFNNVKEEDVRSCVAQAQSRRLILSGHAESFLNKHWPGWGDIGENGNPNRQYSQIIVEELAKLCKLGISKEDAKVRLKAQTYKRRTSKLRGVSHTPALQRIDIKNVIADITGVPSTQAPVLKSQGKKAKGKKDTTYYPACTQLQADSPPQSAKSDADQLPAVPSTNGEDASPNMPELDHPSDADSSDSFDAAPATPRSRQQTGTPDRERSVSPAPANANDTANEIETGRPEWRHLSGEFDSPPQSYGICSSAGASPTPTRHSSPVTGLGEIQPASLQNLKRRAPDSPVLNKRRRAGEHQCQEQVLSALGNSEKLTGSFVNDVLQHYVVDRPEVYLVDSSELAKWDTASSWNKPVQHYSTAGLETSEPKINRRLKAQSARRFIIPFHHPIQEHWTLWVALHDEDSGAWVFEHYDSLPQRSSDHSAELAHMENIVRQYLGWLLQAPIVTVTVKVKECAVQADSVSCGIYLIANAIAVAQDFSVPQSVDPQLIRRELQDVLQKPFPSRPENPGIVAPPPVGPFTDSALEKSSSGQQPSNMPETHLLEAQTELNIRTMDLGTFCNVLEALRAEVAEVNTVHQEFSQQAAEALAKQESADRNIEKIRTLEELPNANENDPSSTEIMARYSRSAERAAADRAEYGDRALAALVHLRALETPLREANERIVSAAMAWTKAREYVEHLRQFRGSDA